MTDYVELHCHSNFSLLDGAAHPEEMVQRAHELAMPALALTDHDAVYGAVRFVQACHAYNLKPILGAEMTLDTGHHLTLLVRNPTGWHNLCTLITAAQHNAPKGEAALREELLCMHNDGLIALSGCHRGIIADAIHRKDWPNALTHARYYRDMFGAAHFWIELQHHWLPDDRSRNAALVELANEIGVGIVATNNVHYPTPDKHRLQDVLVCIRHQICLDDAFGILRPNSEYYLKSGKQMAALFADYPKAILNTSRVADACQFDLDYGLQALPRYPTPDEIDAITYLKTICEQHLDDDSSPDVEARLRNELEVIYNAGLANYFLIVWDIVRFAHEHGILCQGRGSAANSLVAYLLGITRVDPLAHHLVFERFLSQERHIAPDIDIDFQADRREEVIQYIYERYGYSHAAMACTFVTFRRRSAIRDVGKALGLSPHLITYITDRHEQTGQNLDTITSDIPAPQPLTQLNSLCEQIKGFPRHVGIHNGGMIITGSPLATRVPTEPATMDGRVVVQWDKDALETVGLVKIDILGLRMLSAIAETVEVVEELTKLPLDLDTLTFDDPAVYEMIGEADTVGIFQVESRAQQQVLPRLQPTCFNDLIVSISLIRPGPVQGNMVHPYLRRRLGEEPVEYLHPCLEPVLAETLGVILFQEQVLKVAHVMAGFTHGQGELLRRALGSKNAVDKIGSFREAFIQGALQNNIPLEIAETTFSKLEGFAGYSFPKSHAAAFAVLVYQSAWLKYTYPAAFYVALLNHQPMGFWHPAVLINDAKRHGIETLGVDIHHSQFKCTVEKGHIRLGYNYIPYTTEVIAERIITARQRRAFGDLKDFCQRTRLPRRMIESLIMIGAMDEWDIPRRQLLWTLGKLDYGEDALDLIYPEDNIELPALTSADVMATEYDILGATLERHPVSLYRHWLDDERILGSVTLSEVEAGQHVRVAGLLVVRQSPKTAKGHTFLTLEDEDGFINIVLRPHLTERYRRLITDAALLIVEGLVQRQNRTINIIASKIMPMPSLRIP